MTCNTPPIVNPQNYNCVLKSRLSDRLLETDKAYLAGLIDGEGCIAILKGRQSHRQHLVVYRLSVVVVQANFDLLDYWQKKTGLGKIYLVSRNSKKPHHRDSWQWCFGDYQAKLFLELIAPYIILKQDQVSVAISFGDTIGKGYFPMERDEVMQQREEAYLTLKALHGSKE